LETEHLGMRWGLRIVFVTALDQMVGCFPCPLAYPKLIGGLVEHFVDKPSLTLHEGGMVLRVLVSTLDAITKASVAST
jgi:hypothetical protein